MPKLTDPFGEVETTDPFGEVELSDPFGEVETPPKKDFDLFGGVSKLVEKAKEIPGEISKRIPQLPKIPGLPLKPIVGKEFGPITISPTKTWGSLVRGYTGEAIQPEVPTTHKALEAIKTAPAPPIPSTERFRKPLELEGIPGQIAKTAGAIAALETLPGTFLPKLAGYRAIKEVGTGEPSIERYAKGVALEDVPTALAFGVAQVASKAFAGNLDTQMATAKALQYLSEKTGKDVSPELAKKVFNGLNRVVQGVSAGGATYAITKDLEQSITNGLFAALQTPAKRAKVPLKPGLPEAKIAPVEPVATTPTPIAETPPKAPPGAELAPIPAKPGAITPQSRVVAEKWVIDNIFGGDIKNYNEQPKGLREDLIDEKLGIITPTESEIITPKIPPVMETPAQKLELLKARMKDAEIAKLANKPKITPKEIYDKGVKELTADLNKNARKMLDEAIIEIDRDLVETQGTGIRGITDTEEWYGIKSTRPKDLLSQPLKPGKNSLLKWQIARDRLTKGNEFIPANVEFLVETNDIEKARNVFNNSEALKRLGFPTQEEYNYYKQALDLADKDPTIRNMPEIKEAREVVKRYERVREKVAPQGITPQIERPQEAEAIIPPPVSEILKPAEGIEYEAEQKAIRDKELRTADLTRKQTEIEKRRRIEPIVAEKSPLLAGLANIQRSLFNEISQKIGETAPSMGLGIRKVGTTPSQDIIKGEIKFSPEIEKQFQEAKGIQPENLSSKVKGAFDVLWKSATRSYPELPNTPEYAKLKSILGRQAIAKEFAKENAIRTLQGITYDLGKKQFDLFSRKVIIDDLAFEVEQEHALPFGFTPDEIKAEKAKLDKIVEDNPVIKTALDKRSKVQEAIKQDLINFGLLKEEQAINPNYFRHQVLEYAREKAVSGVGRKLRAPSPGYAKKRMGSEMAINTDYLQAEMEYMSQALHDIETMKNLQEIEKLPLNIKPSLVKMAKEKGLNWRDIVPEGFKVWQPKEGRVFYLNRSIPEKAIDQILEGTLPEDLVKEFIVAGQKRKELVLPEGVVNTFNNLYSKPPQGIAGQVMDAIVKTPITWWKRWVLFNPVRLLKYNYQNTLGDLDAIIAGNPNALRKFPRATAELYDHFYGDKPMTEDLHDFFERGGVSAGLTIAELPEIKDTAIFGRLYAEKQSLLSKANLVKSWFSFATKASTFRENILRYSAYLDYLDRFKANEFKGKWMLKYGASNAKEVDALTDPKDKAAKVATELLGDYANLTALGKELRTRLMPFYSWMEVNAKRYPIMLKNAFEEGKQSEAGYKFGATTAGKVGLKVLGWLTRASALWALVQVWNSRYPDIEDDLNDYDRRRMHITLGRDKEGRPMILRGQGALGDFLEWFGVNEIPHFAQLLAEGKIDLAEIMKEVAKAPLNKILSGISPSYKIPLEMISGKSLFPDALDPQAVRDGTRNALKSLSAEDLYDWLTGKPQRPLSELILKATPLVVSDPKENAYWEIQNLKRRFLEKKGKGKFSGGAFSPQSEALYQYKKALKMKDKKAEEKYRAILEGMGIKRWKIKRNLRNMKPLSGLDYSEKKEFTKEFLTDRDRNKLRIADQFYRDVLEELE